MTRRRPKQARKQGTQAARRDRPQDEKRERRIARQEREAAARRRAQRRKKTVWIAGVAAVLVGVVVIASLALRRDPELEGVERPPSRGRGHIAAPRYDSATPTSGPHLVQVPRCTSYAEPLDPGLAVHALEHGAVVLWYDAGEPELRTDLEELLANWDSHVLITAHANLDDPIVATAWNRRAAYQRPDVRVEAFVETYRKRGPESEPCDP